MFFLFILSSPLIISIVSSQFETEADRINVDNGLGAVDTYSINDTSNLVISGRDYSVEINRTDYSAYFRDKSSDVNNRPVAIQLNDYYFTISPDDFIIYNPSNPTTNGRIGNRIQSDLVIVGDSAVYPDQYTKVGSSGVLANLTYTFGVKRLKENLVISDQQFIRDRWESQADQHPETDLEFESTIRAYKSSDEDSNEMGVFYGSDKSNFKGFGASVNQEVKTPDEIYFTDENNETVFYVPKAYARDSIGNEILLNKTIKMTGFGNLKVGVLVPFTWLNSSSTIYPIYIDPTTKVNATVFQDINLVSFKGNSFEFNVTSQKLSEDEWTTEESIAVGYDGSRWTHNFTDSETSGWDKYRYLYETDGQIEIHGTRVKFTNPTAREGYWIYPYEGEFAPCTFVLTNSSGDVVNSSQCNFNSYRETVNETMNVTHSFLEITFFANGTVVDPIISGDTSYDSHNINVTTESSNEEAIGHLEINSDPPYDKLLAYWNFDRDNSTTAFDFSGNNHDGVYGANLLNTDDCAYNDCLNFTSTDDAVNLGYQPEFFESDNITVMFWLYLQTTASDFQDTFISFKGGNAAGCTGPGTTCGWIISYHFQEKLNFAVFKESDSASFLDPSTITSSAGWTHVAMTWNGTTLIAYKNAAEIGRDDIAASTAYTPASFINACIGAEADCSSSPLGLALMDEIMIFNSSLSSSQITDIYNNQSSRFAPVGDQNFPSQNFTAGNNRVNITLTDYEANLNSNVSGRIGFWDADLGYDVVGDDGLISYWGFNSVENGYFNDSLGRYNGTTVGASFINYTDFKFNSSVSLDGGNDEVDFGTITETEHATGLTMGVWIKNGRSTSSSDDYILGDSGVNGAHSLLWISDEHYSFEFKGNTTGSLYFVDSDSAYTDAGTWHHLVGRFTGNSTGGYIDFWVDGVKQADSGVSTGTNAGATDSEIEVGGITDLLGEVDEAFLFNRSLSEEEIKSMYYIGRTTKESSGVGIDWNYTDYTNFTESTKTVFNQTFTNGSTNWYVDIRYIAGNMTSNPFYTPIVAGNVTVDFFGEDESGAVEPSVFSANLTESFNFDKTEDDLGSFNRESPIELFFSFISTKSKSALTNLASAFKFDLTLESVYGRIVSLQQPFTFFTNLFITPEFIRNPSQNFFFDLTLQRMASLSKNLNENFVFDLTINKVFSSIQSLRVNIFFSDTLEATGRLIRNNNVAIFFSDSLSTIKEQTISLAQPFLFSTLLQKIAGFTIEVNDGFTFDAITQRSFLAIRFLFAPIYFALSIFKSGSSSVNLDQGLLFSDDVDSQGLFTRFSPDSFRFSDVIDRFQGFTTNLQDVLVFDVITERSFRAIRFLFAPIFFSIKSVADLVGTETINLNDAFVFSDVVDQRFSSLQNLPQAFTFDLTIDRLRSVGRSVGDVFVFDTTIQKSFLAIRSLLDHIFFSLSTIAGTTGQNSVTLNDQFFFDTLTDRSASLTRAISIEVFFDKTIDRFQGFTTNLQDVFVFDNTVNRVGKLIRQLREVFTFDNVIKRIQDITRHFSVIIVFDDTTSTSLTTVENPQIFFVNPTGPNGTTVGNTTGYNINTTIVDQNPLTNLTFNWNGTVYTVLNDSLVLALNFDNRSALGENDTHVKDISNYGVNGTIYTNVSYSEGKYGLGLNFTYNKTYVNLTSQFLLGANNPYTISWWENSLTAGSSGTYQTRFILKVDGATSGRGLDIIRTADPSYGTIAWGGTNTTSPQSLRASGAPSLSSSVGVWKQFVLIGKEGANSNKASAYELYVDGESYSITSGSTYDSKTNTLNRIGWDNLSTTIGAEALIDEVRIWNRSLTEDEVIQNYRMNLQKFNSTTWNLEVNQTKNLTHTLDLGEYTYQTCVTDSLTKANCTDIRTVIVSDFVDIAIIFPEENGIYSDNPLGLNVTTNNSIAEWIWSLDDGVTNTSFSPNTTMGVGSTGVKNLTVYARSIGSSTWVLDSVSFTYISLPFSWDVSSVAGIIAIGLILIIMATILFDNKKWIIKMFLYLSGILTILLAVNMGLILSEVEGVTTLMSVSLIITIVTISLSFLYLFIFATTSILKAVKIAKEQKKTEFSDDPY